MKVMKKVLFILAFLCFPLFVQAKEFDVNLYFFRGEGCPHCAEEEKFLETIKNKYDNLTIIDYEVWYNDENAELLGKVLDAFDIKKSGVPVNVIGDTVIMGFGSNTGSRIERAIEYYSNHEDNDQVSKIIDGSFVKQKQKKSDFEKKEETSDKEMTIRVPFLGNVNLKKVSLMSAAVIIGLIDGFNPCAMWILLFLISVLIGMKNRKRMWVLGITFLLTSALVYMLIMLSWIQIAVKITTVIWIRNVIAIVALIGAFINLKSFVYSKDESGCEVVDDKKRKTIFRKIRKFTSEKNFILALLGVFWLAVSVNLVELACSAGLP